MIRQFLPKVNWEQLDIKNRSAAECEARWMSSEDPLINNGPWTVAEDNHIRLITQNKGFTDWLDIAVSLGTNRTPFQCLVRYQRSLNPYILRKEWTAEEDDQLRAAVDLFGETDWQSVANVLQGRTGPQCSNRSVIFIWKKSLHPSGTRNRKWSSEEDKRLKVAVTLFGTKNWPKIAQFVPGRTGTQCLERWGNPLDPKLKFGKWTKEEDAKLGEAMKEHGHCWSKVASYMSCRTDNQCARRWKSLYPHLALLRQEARRLQKETTIGNFVDRESERPDLVVGDFLALTEISLEPERKARQKKKADAECEVEAVCADTERQPKKRRKGLERCM
ncbi:PREDICTED: myb-like protein L [Camelina sativa]|uniref:Myb-like protein L n=1 Tax=Camelina sativa TaxID=90675 RepID=A0ABM1QKU9_CAMSA|nr:PREDICTED: myb-like protein L [Camelina sativa]